MSVSNADECIGVNICSWTSGEVIMKSDIEKRETFLHPSCVNVSVYGRFLTYFHGSPFWGSFVESMREII